MRIGILTHPQAINYGGILQCYALSTFLRDMGHEVIVIRRELDITALKKFVITLLKRLHVPHFYSPIDLKRGNKIYPFSERYLTRTKPIRSQVAMCKVCSCYNLESVIVGSDQVWRADFALKYGYNFFLDFVPSNVLKLSYAASFGLSEWQYSSEQTELIKKMLTNFSGISVREREAISLCKDNIGVSAVQSVDPTMLLTSNEYDKIACQRIINKNYVFIYWLGDISLVDPEVSKLKLEGKEVVLVSLREISELPSVEEWLSYIKYSDYVITDSFHGAVFSLIYHRPIKILPNSSGGYGRIESLLQIVGFDINKLQSLKPEEFGVVDNRIKDYRLQSRSYLNNALQ
jgi:hypothetical protein